MPTEQFINTFYDCDHLTVEAIVSYSGKDIFETTGCAHFLNCIGHFVTELKCRQYKNFCFKKAKFTRQGGMFNLDLFCEIRSFYTCILVNITKTNMTLNAGL